MSYEFKEGEEPKALNKLAREQMKMKLLADIAVDMQVCKLEGYDPAEYVDELLGEVERIAIGVRRGSEIPLWRHVCGACAAPISVFDSKCGHCGAEFDMDAPMVRRLISQDSQPDWDTEVMNA